MTVKLKPNVSALVDKVAAFEEVQEIVARAADALATTQHDYAGWASRIDSLANALSTDGPTTNMRIIAAESLRRAGGNSAGINAAMFSMFGVDAYSQYPR